MSTAESQIPARQLKPVRELETATVRLAGDSGDGMQLAGGQFTNTSALAGNDLATLPDFPAEIRAPKGTLAGVSGFQIHFAARDVLTPGDRLDALVAMNPAALRENLRDLEPHGVLIVDEDAFDAKGLKLAHYVENPLENGSLDGFQLIRAPITKLTRAAVEETGIGKKLSERCRNFFALGLVYWLYGRDPEPTRRFIENKFKQAPDVAEANRRALEAGWNFGETSESVTGSYHVPPAQMTPGRYRNITGNQGFAWGLITAAKLSGKELFYGSYPITPASDILHELSRHKQFGVRTFQAEDEIAAMTSIVGAAFGGAMGVTASAGPGIALKSEAMGLAVMLELPLLILDIQRAGPSTGMPTKTEQADLLQVMFGRSGEAPMPVLAASTPADCFDTIQEAWRIATAFMTPVVVLSDAYIATSAEPWKIPDVDGLEPIPVSHPGAPANGAAFMPYARDERLVRPWALPGTPGLMHRLGGLEKQDITGNVSYDPENHNHMVRVRARKVENVASAAPLQRVDGPDQGDLLILSWGGVYGACASAVHRMHQSGAKVALANMRHLHPMPANMAELLGRYRRVLIPELNSGQLRMLIRSRYLIDAVGLNKSTGRPFSAAEIEKRIKSLIS